MSVTMLGRGLRGIGSGIRAQLRRVFEASKRSISTGWIALTRYDMRRIAQVEEPRFSHDSLGMRRAAIKIGSSRAMRSGCDLCLTNPKVDQCGCNGSMVLVRLRGMRSVLTMSSLCNPRCVAPGFLCAPESPLRLRDALPAGRMSLGGEGSRYDVRTQGRTRHKSGLPSGVNVGMRW